MATRQGHPASVFFYYLASAVLCIIIMMQLQAFLIPFTYAILLTYLLFPALKFLEKKKIPKTAAILVLLLAMFLIMWLLGSVIIASISGITELVPFYQERFVSLLNSFLGVFGLTFERVLQEFHITESSFSVSEISKMVLSTGVLQNTADTFSRFFIDMIMVLIFWLFMIGGKEAFEKKVVHLFGSGSYPVQDIIGTINKQIQSYVTIKTAINASLGILTSALLSILGVDLALFMGLLTFIIHYIPNIGAIFSALIPILFTLLQFGVSVKLLLVIIIIGGLQFSAGNFIEPRVMGKRLNISPMVALLSLFFWGWVWGIAGMFLAIPFTSILMIFLRNIPELQAVGMLMQEKTGIEENDGQTT